MTIGIYRLVFKNTDKCYVGQSVHIEKRFKQHLHSLKTQVASPRLLEAYSLYGIPQLEILAECLIEQLDEYEDEAIELLNSAFNTHSTANQAPYGKGIESGNSKYTRSQLLDVFNLLTTDQTLVSISKNTGVGKDTVYKISIGISHTWLQEELPEVFINIAAANERRILINNVTRSLATQRSLCAVNTGITYPSIKAPDGTVYNVYNVQQFARDYDIPKSSLHRLLTKQSKHARGWTLCQEEHRS